MSAATTSVGWPLLLAGDLLIFIGLLVLTLGLVGIFRFDAFYTRLHAAAKIGSLGLSAVLMGTVTTGDPSLVLRALVIVAFLVFTAPVTTHMLARAAHRRRVAEEGDRSGGGASQDDSP